MRVITEILASDRIDIDNSCNSVQFILLAWTGAFINLQKEGNNYRTE